MKQHWIILAAALGLSSIIGCGGNNHYPTTGVYNRTVIVRPIKNMTPVIQKQQYTRSASGVETAIPAKVSVPVKANSASANVGFKAAAFKSPTTTFRAPSLIPALVFQLVGKYGNRKGSYPQVVRS